MSQPKASQQKKKKIGLYQVSSRRRTIADYSIVEFRLGTPRARREPNRKRLNRCQREPKVEREFRLGVFAKLKNRLVVVIVEHEHEVLGRRFADPAAVELHDKRVDLRAPRRQFAHELDAVAHGRIKCKHRLLSVR